MPIDAIKTAQAIGILGCAFTSALTLPAHKPPSSASLIQITPGAPISHITHQWLYIFSRGKQIFPDLAAISSTAHVYLAWADSRESNSVCYALAAAVTMAIVPFTLTVMYPTCRGLENHATRDDAAEVEGKEGMVTSDQEVAKRAREDQEALVLLRRWSGLNAVRALFPLTGAVIGFCAAVCV
ncbi:hypothetical protein ASPWEDRAFT_25307 [Aspergillus wentii DTO 134E9]|uniref:DUF1772 domain-containing protein n=1 Tax=Aspergillus wentii DTO 134E9 TaxID=1073089 RepID=A0A1L9RX31_ASPWE|nr:uncharacterized protein ASPWEDRAFT_25307 [Aspergillus wentii DTO 134E9]OJJ39475.1 hypothetical protein ASPWEDRAFT_25307 [Aspergillus wentii DTO 134E9]